MCGRVYDILEDMQVEQGSILAALKVVRDPDLQRDIVSLGFIKDLKIDGGRVSFTIELTTPACPVKDQLRDQARAAVMQVPGVSAVDVQWEFHHLAQKHLRHSSAETNWLLENWGYVLEAIPHNRQALIGGVDWITKKWLLETFVQAEGLSWDDPWLQSIDLEYHNIDPRCGLFFSITPPC